MPILGYAVYHNIDYFIFQTNTLEEADTWIQQRDFPEDYEVKRLVTNERGVEMEEFIAPGAKA